MKLFTSKRERGRVVQNLTVLIDYRADPQGMSVSRTLQSGMETFQWLDQSSGDQYGYVDSEALRSAFFSVRNARQAEAFLCACGPFRHDGLSLTWPKFQEWQAYFKTQRLLGAAGGGWGAPPEYADYDRADRICRVPVFEPLILPTGNAILAARADSATECIAALNFIDRWSKVAVLSCRQCGDPFTPKTKASFCCSHSCAHTHWRANGNSGARRKHAKAAK